MRGSQLPRARPCPGGLVRREPRGLQEQRGLHHRRCPLRDRSLLLHGGGCTVLGLPHRRRGVQGQEYRGPVWHRNDLFVCHSQPAMLRLGHGLRLVLPDRDRKRLPRPAGERVRQPPRQRRLHRLPQLPQGYHVRVRQGVRRDLRPGADRLQVEPGQAIPLHGMDHLQRDLPSPEHRRASQRLVRQVGSFPHDVCCGCRRFPDHRVVQIHGHAKRDGQSRRSGRVPFPSHHLHHLARHHGELVDVDVGLGQHHWNCLRVLGFDPHRGLEPRRERMHLPHRGRRFKCGLLRPLVALVHTRDGG
mmetsp:Transcript_102605/g.295468  ORF Transcript_102605/g.295468 Transcript_102605/m.295468 type:complete len:302 (-) Transcript_102605:403-1308(-)